jgi:nucleotide-binding universal stress UspA family protein
MKTILAPIDFSPVTATVVAEALQLARWSGGRLVLLHVIEPPSAARDAFPAGRLSAEVLLAAKQAAQVKLEALLKTLPHRETPVEVLRVTGSPAHEILSRAESLGARYLVIGSHGHGAMYDLLVGSVVQDVLKQAKCPVLIVGALRPGEKAVGAAPHAVEA